MTRGTKIAGSRILITGAGSGIGRLMALEAADRGAAEVIIWDLSAETGEAVRQEIEAKGVRARTFSVNVGESAQVASTAQDVGDIDILVNCAGVVTGKKLLDADEAAIRRTFDVNTMALYWTTRGVPCASGNATTVRSSISPAQRDLTGVAKQTDYSASKWAAVGFTESLRGGRAKEAESTPSSSARSTSTRGCSQASRRSSPACCRSSKRTTCPLRSSTRSNPVVSSWSCPHSCAWFRVSASCRPARSTQ